MRVIIYIYMINKYDFTYYFLIYRDLFKLSSIYIWPHGELENLLASVKLIALAENRVTGLINLVSRARFFIAYR